MGLFTRWKAPHPTAVERVRMEPAHPRNAYPVGSDITAPTTRRELAPQPVAQSGFDGIGKRPQEMVRPVCTLSIAEWTSVAQWPFAYGRPLVPMRVPIAPHQGMNPLSERVNIDMMPQSSLGAQASIKAVPYTGPEYLKLGRIY